MLQDVKDFGLASVALQVTSLLRKHWQEHQSPRALSL